MTIILSKLPIFRQNQWSTSLPFPLMNLMLNLVWVMRLFSLPSWLAPFFQVKVDSSFYTHKKFSDYYLIGALLTSISIVVLTKYKLIFDYFAIFWAIITLLDLIQYQLNLVLIRPAFQKNYSPYSSERTIVILLMLYIQSIISFSLIYAHCFSTDFNIKPLGINEALEFSIITITTLGYGNLYATPGSSAALVAALEALCGVFFLGLFISTAVGRGKNISSLNLSPTKMSLQKRCLSLIDKNGYSSILNEVSNIMNGNLWVIGGWVRNSALGIDYVGDIDCITTLRPQEIEELFDKSSFVVRKNRFGTYRLILPDKNHLDIVTTYEQAGTSDIVKAIRKTNFSINSAAINYSDGRLICSEYFFKDLKLMEFRITGEKKSREKEFLMGFVRDMDVLEQYYGLKGVKDDIYKRINKERMTLHNRFESMSFEGIMKESCSLLTGIIPLHSKAWVVRGFPRCALLGELKYWDDLDVIVDTTKEKLIFQLDDAGANWTMNYFENPKVFHSSGITIDIWVLDKDETIECATSKFPHSVDRLAWSVSEEKIINSNRAIKEIENRVLKADLSIIYKLNTNDGSYAAIKAIYLIIRHNLQITEDVCKLLKFNIHDSPLLKKHALNLVKELHLCGVSDISEAAEYINSVVGDNEAVNFMVSIWKKPLTNL